MPEIQHFIDSILNIPRSFCFQDFLNLIEEHYHFTPTAFQNGKQYNAAGENNGSCKVFAFASLHQLSKEKTLLLFAEHYQSVLQTPEAQDHSNIRNFMQFGWESLQLEGEPLQLR